MTATSEGSAFLAGPPLIGFLGDHFTVLRAILAVAVLLAMAIMITSAIRPPTATADRHTR